MKNPKEKAINGFIDDCARLNISFPIKACEKAINIALKAQAEEIFKKFPKLTPCSEHPKGDGLVCGWCYRNRTKEMNYIKKLKQKHKGVRR